MDSPTLTGFTQFLLRVHDFAVKAESGTRSLVFRLVRYCMTNPALLPPIVSTVRALGCCCAALLKLKTLSLSRGLFVFLFFFSIKQGFQLLVICGLEKDHELVLERMQALRIMLKWIEVRYFSCLSDSGDNDVEFRRFVWTGGRLFHSKGHGPLACGCSLPPGGRLQARVLGDASRAACAEPSRDRPHERHPRDV
jgi:hypothetical protein